MLVSGVITSGSETPSAVLTELHTTEVPSCQRTTKARGFLPGCSSQSSNGFCACVGESQCVRCVGVGGIGWGHTLPLTECGVVEHVRLVFSAQRAVHRGDYEITREHGLVPRNAYASM